MPRCGRGESTHISSGHRAAEARTEQGERLEGLQAPAERCVVSLFVRVLLRW